MPEQTEARIAGTLFGAITVLCWAGFNVAAKAGVDAGMSPSAVSFLRYLTPGFVAFPLLIWLRHRNRGKGLPGLRLCILAVLGGPLFGLIAVAGYQYAPLSHGLLFAPVAVFVSGAVFGAVLLKERIFVSRVLGAFIMFGGLAVLVGFETPDARGTWLVGTGLFTAAGIMWGGYTVLLRLWQVPLLEGTSAIAAFGAVFAALLLGPAAWPSLAETSTVMLLTQLVMQGIVGGILSVVVLVAALQRLTAQTAAVLPTFTPAVAMIIAWVVFGTRPHSVEFIGAAVIFLGFSITTGGTSVLNAIQRRRSAASETNPVFPT
ncbi:DMT family transporter [uncultured Roseobacter sp.]|uniref:DMT family transporter n=1 Tax=uncultured Roseobacter sp. TaxID=114847 RepID=UPI0026297684|nr:DMT family transporter [uncultured Roseobacter sp.]